MDCDAVSTDYDPSFIAAFGDGEYRFRLCGIKEWAEVEEKTKAPLFVLLDRLLNRACGASDIYEPIRLALIGGGLKPVDALKLCQRYVVERPLAESLPLALACVSSAIVGPEQKKSAEPESESPETTDASTTAASSEQPKPSA